MRSHEYADAPEIASADRRRYRHNAQFIADWREHCRPIDRNQRAKIMFFADALERRTKAKGGKNGVLGEVGLKILRALVLEFLNRASGMLCPSYQALMQKTGLCRQSVASGLARLEGCGILKIARRLCRRLVDRVNPITGKRETIRTTTQASNLYSVHAPGAWADARLPARGRTRFPARRQLALLERLARRWEASPFEPQPSPPSREEPARTGATKISDLVGRAVKRARQGA